MTAKYLLPCGCGQHIAIEPRQAGQTIRCSCGTLLSAPTLLEITALEPAPQESAPAATPSAWSAKHRLRLMGVLLVAASILGGAWLYAKRPVSQFDAIDPEQIRQTALKLPPARSWDIWETMKQGLDRRTDQKYEAALGRFRVWQAAVGAVAVVGVALIAASAIGLGIRD